MPNRARRISVASVYVTRFKLDLLNAFAKFLKEFINRATCTLVFRCQNIESHAARKIQFKFFGVLIVRHIRESRGSIGCTNSFEVGAVYGDSDCGFRRTGFAQKKVACEIGIEKPR